MEEVKGLTVIFTGNGKGKTSAALGAALRALGHGWRVKVIQFIKANRETGEILLLKRLSPELEIEQCGKGFTWLAKHTPEEHRQAAQEGFQKALADITSGTYGLVVLDEILYALGKGLVSLADVREAVRQKPPHVHLILTGRGAPPELVEMADLVTSMEPVKHPMEKGIPAQRGLDF